MLQERDRAIQAALARFARGASWDWHVLDLGCGEGHHLAKFVSQGVNPANLIGIDLLSARVASAKFRFPNLHFMNGDAAMLPLADAQIDLALQFTVFSSILDAPMKRRVAQEILRVLKPNGLVLWYDYRLNPTNSQTRGIDKNEIRNLFFGCEYLFQRLTLAPPLLRALAPRSWLLCALLSQIDFLKTHYFAVIRKR